MSDVVTFRFIYPSRSTFIVGYILVLSEIENRKKKVPIVFV